MLRLFIFNAPSKARTINAYAVTSEGTLGKAEAKIKNDTFLDIDGEISFVVAYPVLVEIDGVMLLTPEPERYNPVVVFTPTRKQIDNQLDRINGEA